MKKLFGLLALAIVAIAFAACGSSNTPEAVAQKYLKAQQKSDWDTYFKLRASDTELSKEDKQMLIAKGDAELKELGGIESFEIKETEMAEDGQSAKVKYDIEYGNGKVKENEVLKLVLVDGKKWKVKPKTKSFKF